ncbi:MAG TPA: hypothetical protein VMJ10_14225, partial [Kofleriaceae bacterium]|nr:hypothetical protein [Kofleriaceae bacterium]
MTDRRDPDAAVVEIDAMDVAEWERDKHTPLAPTEGLAELVKKSADVSGPVKAKAKADPTPAPRKTATIATVPRAKTANPAAGAQAPRSPTPAPARA